MSDLPVRPGPSKDGGGFMFINFQGDMSQTVGVGRQKKAFLSKQTHQKRKQESINRLRYSRPLWKNVLQERNQLERSSPSNSDESSQGEIGPLTQYIGQGYVDPFDTASVHMTDAMNMYFHHYRDYVVASAFPLDGPRMSIVWSHNALGSPGLLQIFLFLAAAHKSALESSSGLPAPVVQKSFRDAIHFRVNTIRTLNDLLQNPATASAESTIMLVGSIMSFEALNAEFNALETHMQGLETLIRLRGGLEVLDHITLEKVYYADIAYAALRNSRPSFPMLPRFRSGVLQEARMFQFHGDSDRGDRERAGRGNSGAPSGSGSESDMPRSLASLGARFAAAPWFTQLDPSMQYTIDVCRRLLVHIGIAALRPNVVMPGDNDLYLLLEHHLVSLDYPERNTDLNEPLRQTIFIYLYIRVMHLQSFPIMPYMTDALRECLLPRLSYFQETAPDLLFWILFIGALASQGYRSHQWFVAYLRCMASNLGLEEWNKARVFLGEFFYTPEPDETVVDDLWKEVVGMSYTYIARQSVSVESETDAGSAQLLRF
ncbi:hypothetical protein BJX66DRAFT_325100 [Aspergillus keveii]|uniref:C6 transcription factor n=1 Tax=Aspergillus keveii TaxID=714993 RepID=A0ABR4G6V2_9EURO